jgi:phenylalanine ammonia-lyase
MWDLLQGSGFAMQGESEVNIEEDEGTLRQDRYPLRTAPQFLGPQLEDIVAAVQSVTLECNSTTDNPLIDGTTGHIHHGGNFQAMSVTNALEKSRLALHHIGKLLFTQHTELLNPLMNRGLPPSAASTDPSLNYHCKGVDIACAAYLAELGHVASPVSTHVQSAEMHNQAVNSMALVSARSTLTGVQLVSLIAASYLYVLCQCLDVRSMQYEFLEELGGVVEQALEAAFAGGAAGGLKMDAQMRRGAKAVVHRAMVDTFERTSTSDVDHRMKTMAESTTGPLLNYLSSSSSTSMTSPTLEQLKTLQSHLAKSSTELLTSLQKAYHTGGRGPAPARSSGRLAPRTQPLYEYVRMKLGVKMHGTTNLERFVGDLEDDGLTGGGGDGFEESVGENISRIYEAIRDGGVAGVLAGILEGMC